MCGGYLRMIGSGTPLAREFDDVAIACARQRRLRRSGTRRAQRRRPRRDGRTLVGRSRRNSVRRAARDGRAARRPPSSSSSVHPDLAPLRACISSREAAAFLVEIGFYQRRRPHDPESGAPDHDDQRVASRPRGGRRAWCTTATISSTVGGSPRNGIRCSRGVQPLQCPGRVTGHWRLQHLTALLG
jgi:hypothetical protein